MDQAPRLLWITLHYGAARPERLGRHAAHPELDAVGLELNEDGGLVIGVGGKELVPGRLPARSQQRPVGDDDTAPDQGDLAVIGVMLIDHAQPAGTEKKQALALEHLTEAKRIFSQYGPSPALTRVETALVELQK